MKVKFETVIDGINKYLDREIYVNLSDVQELVARVVVGRINQNMDALKSSLTTNGIIKTMGIIDTDGMVDIDWVLDNVRKEIERKENLRVDVPLIGKMTFCPGDVEVLRGYILGR
jgi:hypothetical protein